MALNQTQTIILRQLFFEADQTQKDDFLTWAKAEVPDSPKLSVTTIEEFLSSKREVHSCPHCGSTHIVKNGKSHSGHQRFYCRDCHHSIGFSQETILFSTKKEFSVWTLFVKCMVQKYSLRKCAAICEIHVSTAFAWRHKILDALTNMMEEVKLDGVVECDETYQIVSCKGNHKKSKSFVMERNAHKRGAKASKNGLSKEEVCITTEVDMGHHSIGRISNLGHYHPIPDRGRE